MTANTTKNSISVPDEYLHVLCDPCRFSGKTTVAMKYCRDCNGHLCPNCVNTHIRVSNTKNHHMSYIINKKNNFVTTALTTTTADLVYGTAAQKALEAKCVDHGKPVVSFCALHDALCCRVCIGTGHRECKLQILSEAANGSRDGKEIRGIEAVIKRLQARFEDIQRDKQTNLQHLGHQNDTFTGAIKTYRRTLNNVLDKLELNLVKKQDRHFETKVEELRGCLKTCQSAISVLNGSLNKLDIATRQGDEQQLFMTIKKVQAITKRYEKIYADVDKLPRNYAFHFIPELSIEKFLKGVSELGKIKDESTTSNGLNAVPKTKGKRSPNDSGSDEKLMASVDLKSRQRSPRKTESPVKQLLKQPLGTDEFSVRLPSDKKTCSITGSAFLPDDKLVVADATNKKIKLFSADLKSIAHLETQTAPRDVTTMSNTEIACTLPNDRTVQVIHVGKTMTVSKSFKLDVECYGICYHDNAFYITSGWSTDKEVQIMDTEGVVQQKLRPEKGILHCPLYVTVDGKLDHIYVSDYETGIVGMDMLGNVTFKFSDTETKGFMGICSSPQGEVFICTLQPNGISRVQTETNRVYGSITTLNEPELEPVISLPTFNKGGQRPRSIAFSRKSQKILVSYVGQSVDMMNIYHF